MTHEHDQAEVERVAREEVEREYAEALKDSFTVFLNMLRGGIAKPSLVNMIHLYGEEAVRAHLMREQQGGQG